MTTEQSVEIKGDARKFLMNAEIKGCTWASIYICLSALSGVIELGVLVLATQDKSPVVLIPLFALAYQLGVFFSNPIRLPRYLYMVLGFGGAVYAMLTKWSTIAMCAIILPVSIALQQARMLISKRCHVSTFWKRVSRVGGFLVAPWFSVWVLVIAGVGSAVLVASIHTCALDQRARFRKVLFRGGFLSVTMLVHQSHYFLYSCFLPWVFLQVQNIPVALLGFAFALGWISYCIAPILFQRLSPIKVFVGGHLLVVVALTAMFFCLKCSTITLIAWFASGFGGGTVYCLHEINKQRGHRAADLDTWENLGHVTGVLAAISIALIIGYPQYVFVTAAAMALVTAALGRCINHIEMDYRDHHD
jgi:hypothetical protein